MVETSQGLEKGVLEIRTSSTEAKHKQRRITWKQLAEQPKMPVESMIKCNLTNWINGTKNLG
jgi:hypothetical protein